MIKDAVNVFAKALTQYISFMPEFRVNPIDCTNSTNQVPDPYGRDILNTIKEVILRSEFFSVYITIKTNLLIPIRFKMKVLPGKLILKKMDSGTNILLKYYNLTAITSVRKQNHTRYSQRVLLIILDVKLF